MTIVPGCSPDWKATALRRLGPMAGSGGRPDAACARSQADIDAMPIRQAAARRAVTRRFELALGIVQPLLEHALEILVEARASVHLGGQNGAIQRVGQERVVQRQRLDVRRLEDL